MLSYADRNALAEQGALPPIPPGALIYKPGPPQFSALAASILGNVGTSADGFDTIFNAVASIIDADTKVLDGLDSILTGVGFVAGALDAVLFSPIAREYAAFAKVGNAALGESDTSTPPPPKPGTKPPPPPAVPMSAWQHKCRELFPWGYDPGSGSLEDPCNP